MAKILCVEDDYFISDMYQRALERAGHKVEVVTSGKDALRHIHGSVYDVILLDLMIPEKNGVDVLRQLRGHDRTALPLSRIIITTNFDEPDEDRAELESMADGYLIKAEVTPSDLLKIIDSVLAQAPGTTQSATKS